MLNQSAECSDISELLFERTHCTSVACSDQRIVQYLGCSQFTHVTDVLHSVTMTLLSHHQCIGVNFTGVVHIDDEAEFIKHDPP